MLRDSTVDAVMRTPPQAILLPMTTMRKSVHGFPFPYMVIGLRLAALNQIASCKLQVALLHHCSWDVRSMAFYLVL